MSVAFDPPASVASWKRSVKPEPVEAAPKFVMVAMSVTGVPAVAVPGVTEPAVRSGVVAGGAAETESELEQFTRTDCDPEVMVTLAV